jgi:hypothetical protein
MLQICHFKSRIKLCFRSVLNSDISIEAFNERKGYIIIRTFDALTPLNIIIDIGLVTLLMRVYFPLLRARGAF